MTQNTSKVRDRKRRCCNSECLLPCCHAISCIFFLRKNVEDLVDDCYKREACLRAYARFIPPCVGKRNWPRIEQQLDSPSIKIGPGMPRKNRKKYPHENPKYGIKMICSVCKSKQHTKRKCLDKDRVVEPILT